MSGFTPPFGGAKYQADEQRKQARGIASLGGSGGTLDYVRAWFLKASQYIQAISGNAPHPEEARSAVSKDEGAKQARRARMHMAWLRNIGGRLKNDYRYSSGIVYYPFPWPQLDEPAKQKLKRLAQAMLDARAAHAGATLADLYDPGVMPQDLRKAHRALDEAADRLTRNEPFASGRARGSSTSLAYTKSSRRRCLPPPQNPSAGGNGDGRLAIKRRFRLA